MSSLGNQAFAILGELVSILDTPHYVVNKTAPWDGARFRVVMRRARQLLAEEGPDPDLMACLEVLVQELRQDDGWVDMLADPYLHQILQEAEESGTEATQEEIWEEGLKWALKAWIEDRMVSIT